MNERALDTGLDRSWGKISSKRYDLGVESLAGPCRVHADDNHWDTTLSSTDPMSHRRMPFLFLEIHAQRESMTSE